MIYLSQRKIVEVTMLTRLFDDDFPDPSILFDDASGWFYLFGTRGFKDPQENIQLRRSRTWQGPWEDLGGALVKKPSWGLKSQEFWAPDVPIRVGGKYRLYYVTNPDNTDGLAIAMASSKKPYGFVPHNRYVISGPGFSTIDPFVLAYQGKHWLYWGSQHEPIRCRQLCSDGSRFKKYSRVREVLSPSTRKFERLLEGFFLAYHSRLNKWFSFISGSDTWKKDEYAITCFSSDSPFGPFERVGILLKPSQEWWAPGQCSIIILKDDWYLVCHAVMASDPWLEGEKKKLKRVPCVARIHFPKGKPRIAPL